MFGPSSAIAVFALALLCIVQFSSVSAANMEKYYKRTGAKYLQKKSEESGVVTLKSGMLVEILKESTSTDAKSPNEGGTPVSCFSNYLPDQCCALSSDTCEVTYSGTLRDGTPFDAGTTSFAPNQVIKGWTEAMQLMAEGDKWKLHIPYDLAYGARWVQRSWPHTCTYIHALLR